MHPPILAMFGGPPVEKAKFDKCLKEMKVEAERFDAYMKGKEWIAGDSMTLADLYIGAGMAAVFQTLFDAGYRKAKLPNLSAWFTRWSKHAAVMKRHGAIQPCVKALKPSFGPPGAAPKEAPKK